MNRFATTLSIVALALVSACGTDSAKEPEAKATNGTSVSPTPTQPDHEADEATPELRLLTEKGLKAALLTVQDMPAGYSQDPPSEQSTNKTFCDYKVPFAETKRVSVAFTKGGGTASEFLSIGIRQYGSADQAKGSFDALVEALQTCTSEVYEGSQLEYSQMSAPKVGDGSVGVSITSDGMTLAQNFAVVGPVMINTGGGGLVQTDADQVASLFVAQVTAYENAAR